MTTLRPLGVHYVIHGGRGFPVMLGYPIMASPMPQDPGGAVLKGYLDRLTDRYRVLVMDYPDLGPNSGRSKPIHPGELTARRVCDDLLAVADAACFDRFVWWGFSWGGVVGLQLASRSDRVAALVCGGWPPLGGPYKDLLRATRAAAVNRPPTFYLPPDQFVTFYESVQYWPEAEAIEQIRCPKMTFVGSEDAVEIAGVKVPLGATIHERRRDLEQQGWLVVEIAGRDHSVFTDPNVVVPIVRSFLDQAI